MHVSGFILFVIFQVATLLAAYAVYLYASRDKARESNDYLKFHFKESIQFQKKLMAELYQFKNKQIEIVHAYINLIDTAISETESRQNDLFKDHKIHLVNDSPMDLQTIALRHIFLQAEKKALTAHVSGNQFWEILEQSYLEIFEIFNPLEKELGTISTLSEDEEDSSFLFAEDDMLSIEELIKDSGQKDYSIHNNKIRNTNWDIHKLRQLNDAQEQTINILKTQLQNSNDNRVTENTIMGQQDKVKELENTIAKSRVIIKTLGTQLKNSNDIIKNMQSALTGDRNKEAEFNKLMLQFVADSQDMLLGIETLEMGKDVLLTQLKQANKK